MNRGAVDIIKIIIGTFLMAVAVNLIYEPMGMVTGGISGFGIVVKEVTEKYFPFVIPVWTTNFVLNIPIFIWAYFVKGKKFLMFTLLGNIMFTVFLGIIPIVSLIKNDFFLGTVLGGIFTGGGLGIVFSMGYSTGGTDLLGNLIHEKRKEITTARVLFYIDTIVIIFGIFVFGVYSGVYGIIAVYIASYVADKIMMGIKESKQLWIISSKYREISMRIMKEIDRGATCFLGRGMYSGNEKNIILCVMDKREMVKVTKIVREIDKKAFLIVQDAREVMGEGFQKNE